MTIPERIELEEELMQVAASFLDEAKTNGDSAQIYRSISGIIDRNFKIGLLFWRLQKGPREHFAKIVQLAQETSVLLENMDPDFQGGGLFNPEETVYLAYLVGLPHPPVDLSQMDENVMARAFFGNVLIGAADIADWPKYRDVLPQGKRYDLARRTNELYADLLAGRITPEVGVPLAEELWAERRSHTYYDTPSGGFDTDNDNLVNYVLGAILKKIGSTVPTVHAWVW
ncbi:MAG: hypothetical protein OJI67_05815 [Prosthecobacter sp.]|nr:hypothetical protein [Prosthecobacter sp.]